jgi:hypothetical protein
MPKRVNPARFGDTLAQNPTKLGGLSYREQTPSWRPLGEKRAFKNCAKCTIPTLLMTNTKKPVRLVAK